MVMSSPLARPEYRSSQVLMDPATFSIPNSFTRATRLLINFRNSSPSELSKESDTPSVAAISTPRPPVERRRAPEQMGVPL